VDQLMQIFFSTAAAQVQTITRQFIVTTPTNSMQP